uniref:Uncharacterized protein n=1 Tax=Caenorhabditis japonica TaxID=281687 RepID=A0A8R1EFN1_CAEJA
MSMLKVKEECDDNMSGSRKWLQRPFVEANSDYLLGTDSFGGAEKFGSGGAASTCSETIDEGSHHVIEDCENLDPLVEANSDYLLGTDVFGGAEKIFSICIEGVDFILPFGNIYLVRKIIFCFTID